MFRTHKVRSSTELDGLWDFCILGTEPLVPGDLVYTHRLPVPGCWEMHPDFLTYRGRGAYRRTFHLDGQGTVRLVFKGVSHSARVYVDGTLVGTHHNAYTPFDFLVRDCAAGDHELLLEVDNSFDGSSALHIPNDYYTYGGPIRPVILELVPECYLGSLSFLARGKPGNWSALVTVGLHLRAGPYPTTLRLSLAGTILEVPLAPEPGQTWVEISLELACPQAGSWSPRDPALHLLEATLLDSNGKALDDLVERVGFRTLDWPGGRLRINQEPVFLKGFNRHEDHPLAGAAIPFSLMVKDIELMVGAGANAVRTSHYPNDELFLDLCDEYGLMVWEENHARGLSLENMLHPAFPEQCRLVNEEMVLNHHNHPAIVIWGLLNECASNTVQGQDMYRAQFEQIRVLDPSRPVTFASCHHDSDICHGLSDVVSLNLYAGWYVEESPRELLDQTLAYIDPRGAAGKALIISEFGADGFYGLHDPARVRGSEERQGDILEENLRTYLGDPRVMGVFVWQFCDCRTHDGGGWFVTRGGSRNNKGVVDGYRRPKLAYDIVKKYFSGL